MWRQHPVTSRAALRLLGLRVDARLDAGPSPIDVAPRLEAFPRLMVFGEWEVSPAGEIRRFIELARPDEVLTIEGAWHADLRGRESEIRDWLDRSL